MCECEQEVCDAMCDAMRCDARATVGYCGVSYFFVKYTRIETILNLFVWFGFDMSLKLGLGVGLAGDGGDMSLLSLMFFFSWVGLD